MYFFTFQFHPKKMNYSTDSSDVCDMHDNTTYINKVKNMFKKLKRDKEGDIYEYYMEYDNTLSIYKVKSMFKNVKHEDTYNADADITKVKVREMFKKLKN